MKSILEPLCRPRMPDVSKGRAREISVSGFDLKFTVPDYSATWGDQLEYNERYDLYDDSLYLHSKNSEESSYLDLFQTRWAIKGVPLFQGEIGRIQFCLGISKYNDSEGLFGKKNLRSIILHDLNLKYGPLSDCQYGAVETLINWRTVKLNNIVWHNYVQNFLDRDFEQKKYSDVWLIPITHEHVLNVFFHCAENSRQKELYIHYRKLILEIMDRIDIKFPSNSEVNKVGFKKLLVNQSSLEDSSVVWRPTYDSSK